MDDPVPVDAVQPEHAGALAPLYQRELMVLLLSGPQGARLRLSSENIANAAFALCTSDFSHTTGLHVPVDAGVAAAFLR